MFLRMTLATMLATSLVAPAAFAQGTAMPRPADQTRQRPGIDARQRMQERRIEAGRQRGAIDAAEARRLQAMQQRIRTLEERLRASDGRLSLRERARLQRMLTQLSRAIARAGRS